MDFVPQADLEFFHAPAVRENSMKKIGNRKEHLCDYASFPDSQPNVPPFAKRFPKAVRERSVT